MPKNKIEPNSLTKSRTYYSSVLNYQIDRVWKLIRDFNNYPRYIESVTESIIEDGKGGDEIGAIRCFRIGESWERQRLTAHSDTKHSFSYAGMKPFEFPSQDSNNVPSAVNYTGTLRLKPIIDGDKTFIEWIVGFNCRQQDTTRWNNLFMDLIPKWVSSLSRTLNKEYS